MESKSNVQQHTSIVASADGRVLAVRQLLSSDGNNKSRAPRRDSTSILHARNLRHRNVKYVEHVGTEIQIRIRELKSLLLQFSWL